MSACAGGLKVRLERHKQPKQNDEGEDFYVHSFQLEKSKSALATDFIRTFSEENDLKEVVILFNI